MKPEFQKLLNLFEELEVAGETVSLTIQSREGKSTIKLQLESRSPPSPSSTATPTIPAASAPVPGGRRRHRGAAARARRRQRAAEHQGTTLAAPASATPAPHQQYHPPLRHPTHLLPSPSPSSGRRQVVSVGTPHWGGCLYHPLAASTWMHTAHLDFVFTSSSYVL